MKKSFIKNITILVSTLFIFSTLTPTQFFANTYLLNTYQTEYDDYRITGETYLYDAKFKAYPASIEEILDGEIVRDLGEHSHRFTTSELAQIDFADDAIIYGLSLIPANGMPTFILTQVRKLHISKTVDVKKIGGVYTHSYYIRKIVDPSQKNLNVPVAYKFTYVTAYYNKPTMTNTQIVYIAKTGDGVKLDKN